LASCNPDRSRPYYLPFRPVSKFRKFRRYNISRSCFTHLLSPGDEVHWSLVAELTTLMERRAQHFHLAVIGGLQRATFPTLQEFAHSSLPLQGTTEVGSVERRQGPEGSRGLFSRDSRAAANPSSRRPSLYHSSRDTRSPTLPIRAHRFVS
jgi:hypothetical protein